MALHASLNPDAHDALAPFWERGRRVVVATDSLYAHRAGLHSALLAHADTYYLHELEIPADVLERSTARRCGSPVAGTFAVRPVWISPADIGATVAYPVPVADETDPLVCLFHGTTGERARELTANGFNAPSDRLRTRSWFSTFEEAAAAHASQRYGGLVGVVLVLLPESVAFAAGRPDALGCVTVPPRLIPDANVHPVVAKFDASDPDAVAAARVRDAYRRHALDDARSRVLTTT